jgi:ABC-type cobalamin/Fe3+-siderophores transport system ATPase subunit
VPKIDEKSALLNLRIGSSNPVFGTINYRDGHRWGQNAAVSLLNDFDHLLQALFAEQNNRSLATHKNVRAGNIQQVVATKLETLEEIWHRILPHRTLEIGGDDISVRATNSNVTYQARDMSDGERAIFYLIGQTLAAAQNSVLIFDEPELHIHRSIMSRLWDELEAARPDCAMVLISHDLEFVASREGQKYVLRDYNPASGWSIEHVPEASGFNEEVTTLILGSRRPILFIEGQNDSLDRAIYRACYPNFTIVHRSSCEEVIHAVITMRANAAFTRITCAGIVDADAYDAGETEFLREKGISVLPVSEIENLFLMPTVVEEIARSEGYEGQELEARISSIIDELLSQVSGFQNQTPIVMRYCRRRIDRTLKKIDLSAASNVEALAKDYCDKTGALDIRSLAALATSSIQDSIAKRDVPTLLKWYDNKGVLGIACKAKGTSKSIFEQWVIRAMRNNVAPTLTQAIRDLLPVITPR